MNRISALGILALAVSWLSACTESQPIIRPSETAVNASASSDSPSSEPTNSATPLISPSESPECFTEAQALEIFRTTDEATEQGFTERYSPGGPDEYVLVLNPSQKDGYTAAWFQVDTGEGELVFDGLTFSYSFGLIALSQGEENDEITFPNVEYRCVPSGFEISYTDEQFGAFGYRYVVSPQGLLASAETMPSDDSNPVTIAYEYSVEQRWLDALDLLVTDLLSGM